jgi:hypothetical protein
MIGGKVGDNPTPVDAVKLLQRTEHGIKKIF